MDLLPKSSEEFSSQRYWDAFFSKRKLDPFEWYGEYPELAGLLHKYISQNDDLLIVGCGNSTLSADLHAAGIKNQTSLDISSVVVTQMKKKYPHLDFIEGDVTDMKFTGTPFSCIFDKGTFDALSPPPASARRNRNKTEADEPEESEKLNVNLMLEEISRVLKPGGRFICISLLQPHVADRLISFFYNLGWMTRIVRCLDAENKTTEKNADNKSVVFPVFMAIFTKLNLPSARPILEASSPSNACTMTRFSELSELTAFVKDQQNFALIKRGLLQLGFCADKELQLQLSNSTTGEDRFIVNVVDVPRLLNNTIRQKFGVFVVPNGRETEWLFGSHEGRTSLAIQANFTRLVVVHLVRGQIYQDMNSIQQELKGPLATLSPSCVTEKGIKAPIMTMGDDVGSRIIVHQGRSEFSGDFVIEDVNSGGKILRRLIFLNSPNIIQSEVEIDVVKKRGKEFRNPVTSKLSCQHHGLMTMSIGFLNYFFKKNEVKSGPISIDTLLIGLGGGMFSLFLVNVIPNLNLIVVEIDPEIVTAAKKYFGLPEQKERLSVIVDDGLKFIQSTESQYNIILIDVDNKSTKEGLSCPPPDFLEASTLESYKKSMKPDGSILVINLVCRNLDLKRHYYDAVQQQFPFVLQCDVPSELNTLLFCFLTIPDPNLKSISGPVLSSCIKLICGKDDNINSSCKKSNGKSKTPVKKNTQPQSSSLPGVDHFDGAFEDVETIANGFKILKI